MKERIAISVPKEVVRQARLAVRKKRAASVSAYFTEAAQACGRMEEVQDLLAEMDAKLGRPSPEAYAWARRVLGT